ncbi:MAG: GNAT family N-acetyltransferase [Paludibacteraceae bacterium]|nr:GNAT family N-acetyltransferase [Paludibacteraceae bacterium]
MNISLLTNYNNIDKLVWSDFVLNHPNGNIFQTPEMFDLYQITPNSEPFIFVALLNNTEIVGVLLAIVHKEFKGLLGNLTSRSIIIGGPLVADNNPEVALALMKTYNSTIKSKAIYSQIRNVFDVSYLKNVFQKLNYVYEDHLDIHVDLTKSEEELWNSISSKKRNKIRKAERESVQVREVESFEDKQAVYQILKDVYKRAKLPLASKELFDNAFDLFTRKKMIRIYGAYFGDILIGTRIVLLYKDIAYDWYAGSFSTYYHKNPNDILPWKIFLNEKLKGMRLFDFGGAGKPGVPYGVRDYKKQFGGELVCYGRYELIHNRFIYSVVSRLFKLFRKLI